MTVSTTIIKNFHNGNASTTNFAYQFRILEDTDLLVIIRTNSTGAETTKTLSTHYTVAGAGDASGGSITFTAGNVPASGETVVIRRNVPQTQAIDYIANDPFPAETHEEGLDRGTMVAQQVGEESDRSLKLSRTNTMTSTEFTVGATDRANKVLSFDANGEIAVAQELGTFKGNSATTTTAAYVVRDIVKGTTTAQLNNIYICIQASPIGTALTNTAYWVLIVDAVSAATSATASASSATASANSATASANSATASANSNTASGNSATASANSATAAATSETNAEAAFDSFDDRYLGAKSSAPSTDNDGNSLLTGALYFNSSSSQIFNWTGSAWEAIKPTSTEQGKINLLGVSAVIADMAILGTTDVVADMAILATNDVVTDMNVLGTSDVVTDMNVLATADVVNDMNVLGTSGTVTAMNLLGTSAVVTDMGILATTDVVADMNTLATADVVNDMNLLGTSTVVGNMNLLGTSTVVANVATVAANVAGVNSFAARYRVGSSNPTSDLDEGDLFYNTTSNVVLFYNGSAWITIVAGNVTQTGSETLTNKTLTDAVAITNSVTGEIIPGKFQGTNFTSSIIVGHATTGTLNDARNNVGIGSGVIDAITSGDSNVGVGSQALTSLTTASSNTAVGSEALKSTVSGSSNTAIGLQAGRFVTGDWNVLIGKEAGNNITSGDGNVIIGGNLSADSATGNTQLIIGSNATGGGAAGSDVLWIKGDSSGNLVTPGTITANGTVLTGAGVTLSGSTNNTLATVTGANALIGEATLTYDATTLSIIPTGTQSNLRLQNSTTGSGGTDGLLIQATGNDVYINNYENAGMYFRTNNTDRMLIDSSGRVLINTTGTLLNSEEKLSVSGGLATFEYENSTSVFINRPSSDGGLVAFFQDDTQEGTISVSGTTVSYNGFTGTHWSRFTDNSTPTILRGTVLESLDEMCDWYNLEFDVTKTTQDEDGNDVENTRTKKIPHVLLDSQSAGDTVTYNHEGTDYEATIVKEGDVKHMMSKVSDNSDAKNVYGLFVAYDLDGEGYNDFYVASVGSYVVRIKSGQTIVKGDLLQSNGDGTAKVQSDDNLKSSSFAKVLSTTIIETYEDGSYLVPCSLMC